MERFASTVNPYPENTNDHCTYYLHARVSNRHPLDRQPDRYPLMPGHTPGPWRARETTIDDPAFTFDIEASQSDQSPRKHIGTCPTVATIWYRSEPSEARSNARLIAAAPELLAALQQLVDAFDEDLSELLVAKLAACSAIKRATETPSE